MANMLIKGRHGAARYRNQQERAFRQVRRCVSQNQLRIIHVFQNFRANGCGGPPLVLGWNRSRRKQILLLKTRTRYLLPADFNSL